MAVKRKTQEQEAPIKNFPGEYHVAPLQKLRKPDWYFKKPLSASMKIKLKKTISKWGAGLIIVRHFSLDILEVIDGWRRVEIMREMGYPDDFLINCIDYGKMGVMDSVMLSRSLNHQWGDVDPIKYSDALNSALNLTEQLGNEVPTDSDISSLTPEAKYQVTDIIDMLDFDWNKFKDELHPDNFMKY